ncbi:hypothetical protein FCL47_08240 [Desulfopila sp. IMCC35006]|uniref:sirohydrochlorin cobaltochelatase n=1 Tax=Desulfopila sp. IMCC35006 TaxID=2569542 RepID=UPI0010AB79A6|nr:sirohydrochlorin cobaltochelatase [Desulfopila sp. IMCC35006]TKB27158.1 hypothetical protein FCL47_08240 [Desulfopila sp. IMCC35006]
MKLPIVISAFGTTSKAIATYNRLSNCIEDHFGQAEIIWAYSSKKITRELHQRQESAVLHPEQVLQNLAARGVSRVIVQSLHLFPGTEFHRLAKNSAQSGLECALGMPLLTSPQDYDQIGEILRPVIDARPEKAIVVLGHGTDHPIWTAYYCLEKILRRKFSPRIFVGVVEKSPDTTQLVDEIAESGFTEVCIIPLFLVAGMHYRRDIISHNPSSWQSRLEEKGLRVESIAHGLGMYDGFENIIIRHIMEASQTIG